MLAFIKAVLPWIAAGGSLAILAVWSNRKKQKETAKDCAGLGLCFGMCGGCVLSLMILALPLSYGIGLGMLVGVLTGIELERGREGWAFRSGQAALRQLRRLKQRIEQKNNKTK